MYNICSKCNTQNEPEYTYCKNCGTPLKQETDTQEKTVYSQAESFNNQGVETEYKMGHTQGIDNEEIAAFIGKKSNEILPKFIKMEITNTKTSWCWPVAILGFLLGPLGAAIWFFYRKMYKPAFVLSAVGILINIIVTVLTLGDTAAWADIISSSLASGDINDILNSSQNILQSVPSLIADFIEEIVNIATFVVTGIYGYYIYKNHCIKKIKEFKMYQADPMHYRLGISALGGTSGGMLALGIAILMLSEYITSFIKAIIAIF